MAWLVAVALGVIGYVVGHRSGVKAGRFDSLFKKQRADGLFQACDAELNELKVKYTQALMQIEDAKK